MKCPYYDNNTKHKIIRREDKSFQHINLDGTSKLTDKLLENAIPIKNLRLIQINILPSTIESPYLFQDFITTIDS